MKKLVCFIVFITLISLCGCSPKNGFIEESGYTYYYDNGEMQTGWKNINGDWYYFYESDYVDGEKKRIGTMKHGTILKEEDDWYYLDLYDGKMAKNRWIAYQGEEYYAGSDGKLVRNKTININGEEYTFDEEGKRKRLVFQTPSYVFGGFNIFLNSVLPYEFEVDYKNGRAVLYDKLQYELIPANSYYEMDVYLQISGIVERLSRDGKVWIDCKLSAIDKDGITISSKVFATSDILETGEKGRVTWQIGLRKFVNCKDLFIEFSPK